jgi:crossover junction endodeoxyribonuclease RuvC
LNILGIDLSLTGTGLAFLSKSEESPVLLGLPIGSRQKLQTFEFPARHYTGWLINSSNSRHLERWNQILGAVLDCASHANQIVIEGYSFGSNQAYARSIAELGGIVRFHLAKRGFTPLEIPPSTLKKFLTGKGNADKNIVLKEVYRRYHVDLDDDNMADAFGLAKLGEAMISTEGLPAFQVEIINALKSPKVKEPKRRKTA